LPHYRALFFSVDLRLKEQKKATTKGVRTYDRTFFRRHLAKDVSIAQRQSHERTNDASNSIG